MCYSVEVFQSDSTGHTRKGDMKAGLQEEGPQASTCAWHRVWLYSLEVAFLAPL